MNKAVLLFALLPFPLFLSSCGNDMMEVMMENKQSVGIVMIKPERPVAGSSDIQFIGGIVTSVSRPVEADGAARVAEYDNHIKTSMQFGQQIVKKLRNQGIDAHLLTQASGRIKTRAPLSPGIQFNSADYASSGRKYQRCIVVQESLNAGITKQGPHGYSVAPLHSIIAQLYDSETNQRLGDGSAMKIKSPRYVPNRPKAANAVFDPVVTEVREELLSETFYSYQAE
jgi:hypothetical protein